MKDLTVQIVRCACVAIGIAALLIRSAESQDSGTPTRADTGPDTHSDRPRLDCCCESPCLIGQDFLDSLFPCPTQRQDEPWQLFGDCCVLPRSGITISGHIQQGATLNPDSPSNPPNPPSPPNLQTGIGNRPGGGLPYRANEYMFNQLLLSIDRPTDTSERGWDVGGHVDLLYGTDYLFYQMRGLETNDDFSNRWNGGRGRGLSVSAGNPDGIALMGLAMPQLYLQAACHDLTVKLGRFYLPLGYERPLVTQNDYYSFTYSAFYNPESPFVLGALAEWQVNDQLLFGGGFHRGFANWTDNNNDLNLTCGIQWTAPNERMFVNYVFDYGRDDGNGDSIRYVHGIALKFKISDRWGYTVTSTYGHTSEFPLNGSLVNIDWYGVVQYLDYTISRRWAAGMRFEWFDDIDGARVRANPLADSVGAGVYYGLTLGLNYRHSPNIVVRPEIRWDWFDADTGVPAGPFADGTKRDQFVAAVDLIITF